MVLQAAGAETFLYLFLLVTVSGSPVKAAKTILADELYDKMRGMWLGQLIGNSTGRATEGKYSGPEPNPDLAVPWVIKQQWDRDDDTDIEYVALHIVETEGLNFHRQKMADEWFTHTGSSGIYIANKQAWHLMKDGRFDWRSTRRRLYDNYQGRNSLGRYYNWVESTINTGATVLAILYGRGDFSDTVQIAVLAGWDCDCNPATQP